MAILMRCTQPHWQGNTFVGVGALRPAGHSQVIPEFFEPYEIEEEAPVTPNPLRAEAEALGIKVDKRWGDDRLREEIDKAKG
jgi:hypothetical protein